MNYLQKKKLAFMSIVNQVKGFVRTVMGALPLTLEGCVDEKSIIDYKIYGQSVQDSEPTPDNPIEVESVGEKTKNLFDIDSYGKLIDVQGYSYIDISSFEIGTTYTISANNKLVYKINSSPGTGASANGGIQATNVDSFTFTMTETYQSLGRLYILSSTTWRPIAKADLEIQNVQLEEGVTATDYEPYGKYKIPVTVSGRNLLNCVRKTSFTAFGITLTPNKDGSITLNGTVGTSNASGTAAISLSEDNGFTEVDGAYTLCGCFGGSTSTYYFQSQNGYRDTGNGVKVSEVADKNRIRLVVCNGVVLDNVTIYPMLIKGDYVGKVPDYDPYHEPVTTNIYLDEPLRKVGDYADYIDFENSKVVREVGKMNLTSSLTIRFSAISTNEKTAVYFVIRDASKYSNRQDYVLSNYFPSSDTFNKGNYGVYRVGTTTANDSHFIYALNSYFGIDDTDTTNDLKLEKIKKWLNDKNSVDEVLIYYFLETPTEQPISLPTIPTFKGTSIVSTDTTIQPSNAEIEYYSNAKE